MTVFKNSWRLDALCNPVATHAFMGGVATVDVELDGQKFTVLNGGPFYKFT